MRRWLVSIAILVLPLLCAVGFYGFHQWEAGGVESRHGLTGQEGNTYKHVIASSRIASVLLKAGVSRDEALVLIERLGHLNERLEWRLKASSDSSAEMVRDMVANLAGFLAAAGIEEHGEVRDRQKIILALIRINAAPTSADWLGLSEAELAVALSGADPDFASDLYEKNRIRWIGRLKAATNSLMRRD